MNTYNQEAVMRPPFGPAAPSNCIIGPSADAFKSTLPEVEEANRMTSIAMAAAPTKVEGMPEQC